MGAGAVDLHVTLAVRGKLQTAGWSDAAIRPYERLTLGQKLRLPATDPRSVAAYFGTDTGVPVLLERALAELLPLRNRVAHQGHLASHDEGRRAIAIARDFLRLVN